MLKGTDFTGVVISFLCHDGAGNIIMGKRSENCRDEHGRWCIGGGGLKFGEKVEHAIQREIQEEYCTEIVNQEFLGYRDVHRMHHGKKTHWISLDFKVLVKKDAVNNGEPDVLDEVRWFPFDALPSPLHSQLPIFLEKYTDKI
jgi:8-oxo-dGTP diphosphatase